MKYDILRPWLSLDPWQEKYINEEKNCFLLCGRQSGKSTAASIKFGKRAATKPNQTILMIALTEKQAYSLYFKTLMYLQYCYPKMIKQGKDKPTKHELNLTNGSKIMCYAAGETGAGLRGFTLTSVVIDEAATMSREIFVGLSPALSIVNGTMDLLSTPRGKEGYFYEASLRDDFVKFYVSAEDCPRHSKEFLESEKKVMSTLEYAQEYLAVFLDELKRIFTDEWIRNVCVLKRPSVVRLERPTFLGCDLARLGDDEGSFEIIQRVEDDNLIQVENIVTKKLLTTETERKILEIDKLYNCREIGIDAGAGTLGVSIYDHLLEEKQTRSKVVAINNRDRPLDKDDQHRAKLLKEDLYNNLVALGERGFIKLLDDDEIIQSLKGIQYEYIIQAGKQTKLRIFGKKGEGGDHIAEGLTRAAWLAQKDKHLKLWIRYS